MKRLRAPWNTPGPEGTGHGLRGVPPVWERVSVASMAALAFFACARHLLGL